MAGRKNEAFKTVRDALRLDDAGFDELSYIKYIDGIDKLCSYLKEELSFTELQSKAKSIKETLQVLSLMKDSTDQLIKLISKLSDDSDSQSNSSQSSILLNSSNDDHVQPNDYIHIPSDSQSISSQNSILINSSNDDHLHPNDYIPIPGVLSVGRPTRTTLSPIEKARRDNGLIYRDFRARCQLVKDSSKKASMYLELHRRLNENIMVARVKEAAVRQQQIEKEKEILELAAKKLASKDVAFTDVANDTKKREKLLLYAQILQYEEIEDWPKREQLKLKKEPLNEMLISDALKNALCVSSHPLSLWMCKRQLQLSERLQYFLNQNLHLEKSLPANEQQTIETLTASSLSMNNCDSQMDNSSTNAVSDVLPLNKMWLEGDVLTLFDPLLNRDYNLCSQDNSSMDLSPAEDHLRANVEDIIRETSEAIETLVYMLCAAYDLDTDEGQDICYHVVENYFFTPIWPHIIQLFRIVNCENEKQMSILIKKFESSKLLDISVPSYFDLESCSSDIMNRFQRVIVLKTPLAKLQQLVYIAQAICHTKYTTGKQLGADELIGIMCFMLINSGIPQLASEFEAIEQLIPHRYLMGEEGYALTTHRTALKFLLAQDF